MNILKSRAVAVGLLALVIVAIAHGATSPTHPIRGGSLVYAGTRMPGVLVPSIEPSASVMLIGSKMLEPLFTLDKDINVVPLLALSMTASADSRNFTIKLRPNVKWHDGESFTSADVAFSALEVWKVFVSNAAFDAITSVETPDINTAVVKTSRPISAAFLSSLLTQPAACVLPRHIYQGKDLRTNPANSRPIGTGPYKFSSRDQSQFVSMERNPTYWDPKLPYLDKITIRVMPDPGTVAAAFESGEVVIAASSSVSMGDARRMSSNPADAVTTKGYEAVPWFSGLLFNLDKPALQDVRVRQAIAYAIDRPFLAKSAFGGYATGATSVFRHDSKFYTTVDVPSYPFDANKARALLNEAGVTSGGKRLKLRIVVAPFGEGPISSGEYLQQALSQVGIDLEMVQVDVAAALRKIYRDNDFDLAISVFTGGPDAALGLPNYFSSKTIDKFAFHNASQYRSDALDAVIDKLASESTPAGRTRLAYEFQRIVMRDLPILPLVEQDQYTLSKREVQNVANNASWVYGSWADLWLKPSRP